MLATATVRNQCPGVSESIRDISRLLTVPSASNVFSVLCYNLLKCMSGHGKEEKRWEDVLYFLVICSYEATDPHCLTDFTGSTKILLVDPHQCVQKDYTGHFQNMGLLGGGTCTGSTHLACNRVLKNKASSVLFSWITLRLIPKHC